jgi:energy-coupling factor transporter ATP-binding protein EcfA2
MSMTGLALQNASLHFSRGTVREELESAEKWGHPAGALTEILGLETVLDTHPLELAQAERKRLALALAAGGNRRAVILDEPTQYQDAEGFRRMAEAVRHIASNGGAVLLISHDPRLYREFPGAGEIALDSRPAPTGDTPR